MRHGEFTWVQDKHDQILPHYIKLNSPIWKGKGRNKRQGPMPTWKQCSKIQMHKQGQNGEQ
jgi:hypothetical protein